MARKGVSVYLSQDLQDALRRAAKDQHRSESSIITEALKARLFRAAESHQADPERRLGFRIESRLDKSIGETLILKEVVLLFIRVWLEHNPPVDEELEEAAAASAEARFERFLDLVANALSPGQSLATRELQTAALSLTHTAPALNGEVVA